jgi:hypothetical protein
MSDSQCGQAITAIIDRYWELCGAQDRARENISKLQAHQKELAAQISACAAVAKQFGVDLATPPAADRIQGGRSIKAMVLQATEDAFPLPVQAAEVRRALGSNGYTIHEKTVGMTLYRLSVSQRVRRDGLDWYFIPQPARRAEGGASCGLDPVRERVLELA